MKHAFVLTPILLVSLGFLYLIFGAIYLVSVDVMDRFGVPHFWFWIVIGFLIWFSIATFIFTRPWYWYELEEEKIEKAV
ncbi:DUF4191 domain-containing protein [Paenibacillus polymyxa]|uniref:DUF4191 domain-containing protein n=1 Tax=Paenibacillus polymyxa TaxID=1406 RepID=UPI001F2672E3|nr:DUF4191 domain-containing protein [Paenibacillus polymyxa]